MHDCLLGGGKPKKDEATCRHYPAASNKPCLYPHGGVKGFTPGHPPCPGAVPPQTPPANGKEDASVEGAVEASGSCGNRKSSDTSDKQLVTGAAGSASSVGRAAGEDNEA